MSIRHVLIVAVVSHCLSGVVWAQSSPPRSLQLEELSWPEVREAIDAGWSRVLLTVGSIGNPRATQAKGGAYLHALATELTRGFRAQMTSGSIQGAWAYRTIAARGPEDWIESGRKQFFDYRKANPDVETIDRAYEDNEPNRAGRDFFPSIRTQRQQALAAHQAGVPLSLGLDTVYYGGIGNAVEFLIEGGFDPMDAIVAATPVAAENIVYGDRIGGIEKGKRADIISVRANPLTERWAWHTVHLVMKDGQRFDTPSWN